MNNFKLLLLVQERGRYYTELGESLYRAIRKNGISTSIIEINIDFPNNLIGKLRNKLLTTPINKQRIRKINETAVVQIVAEKPDIIFVIKGSYLLPDTLKYLKDFCPNSILVCFNPDDPFNINNSSSNILIRDSVLLYDHYLIWSKTLFDKLKNYGAKNVHYFPFALDEEIIYPINISAADTHNFSAPVAFVGNGDKKRNRIISELSSLLSKSGVKSKIQIYGRGIKPSVGLELREVIIDENILKAFSGADINLNILREQNNNSINMRTFEIPGTRKFMLHEQSEEAMEFFQEGKEAEYFRSAEECVDKIRFYLKNERLREDIAKAGYEKIKHRGYTYTANIKNLLSALVS